VSGHKWSDRELTRLEALAGELPLPALVQRYNKWAVTNGFPRRTYWSLEHQISRSGLRVSVEGEYLSRWQAARLSGVDPDRITRIIRDRRPKVVVSGHIHYVNRQDLAAAARNHPEDWYGVDRDGLLALFDDAALADEVLRGAVRPSWSTHCKAVRCLVTGTTYPSIMAAARAGSCSFNTVWRSAKTGRATSWGQRWEWV
jgi:hypothetical protein